MDKKLWEIDHPYYCTETNYFLAGNRHNEVQNFFDTFDEFFDVWGNVDEDTNLLIRWDWVKEGRQNKLKLFYFLQRKGFMFYVEIKVKEKDEPRIREFLQPKFDHIKKLWEPFT